MVWGWGNGWSVPGSDLTGVIMGVIMLVVLVLIVLGIVLLVRGLTRHDHYHVPPGPVQAPPPSAPGGRGALQVLEERYARGEIDREEFLQRKQDILSG
jgi:putative membrane protein